MNHYLNIAVDVLNLEAKALERAAKGLKESEINKIVETFEYLQKIGGALIFCGVGKSGLIGKKLAATFSSLGLRSFFLHPVEALHGDLGMVGPKDAIVFLSKSGTTDEILKLIPFIEIPSDFRIGLLGNMKSPIGEECGILLDCSVEKEACLNNQAPTTSSTLALAMGDALAVMYEKYVGLSKEGFAVNHPGGLLGKTLRLKVTDIMKVKAECPILSESNSLKDLVIEMTKFPTGGCAVMDDDKFIGLIVEGDIRRTLNSSEKGVDTLLSEIVNRNPVSIGPEELAHKAMSLMEDRERQIQVLPVMNDNSFLGFIRLHDLLQAGFHTKK